MHIAARETVVPIPDAYTAIFVQADRSGIYSNLVLLTLLLYDALIMLNEEVAFFWTGRKFGLTRVIFFLNRSVGIAGAIVIFFFYTPNPTQFQCNFSLMAAAVLNAITVLSIDYILMMRVLALYHNEKRLRIFLWTVLIAESIVKIVLAAFSTLSYDTYVASLASGTTACGTVHIGYEAEWDASWTIPLFYGALLLALALYKACVFWRENGLHGSTLIYVLVKDQVLYFGLAILCSVFNIVQQNLFKDYASTASAVLSALGSTTLLCILGSRMLFNLKDASQHSVGVGTDWQSSTRTHSIVRFEDPSSEDRTFASYQMETR